MEVIGACEVNGLRWEHEEAARLECDDRRTARRLQARMHSQRRRLITSPCFGDRFHVPPTAELDKGTVNVPEEQSMNEHRRRWES